MGVVEDWWELVRIRHRDHSINWRLTFILKLDVTREHIEDEWVFSRLLVEHNIRRVNLCEEHT